MKSLLSTQFFLAVVSEKYEHKCVQEIQNKFTGRTPVTDFCPSHEEINYNTPSPTNCQPATLHHLFQESSLCSPRYRCHASSEEAHRKAFAHQLPDLNDPLDSRTDCWNIEHSFWDVKALCHRSGSQGGHSSFPPAVKPNMLPQRNALKKHHMPLSGIISMSAAP